jgi:hypothetical protein
MPEFILSCLEPDLKLAFQTWRRMRKSFAQARASKKNLELFYALKTLSANDVEVENRPACPA